MEKFSISQQAMKNFADDAEQKATLQPVEAWAPKERTENRRLRRIIRSEKNFWEFDKFYFTPEMYSDGYAKPCSMHRSLVEHLNIPGVHIELGPRGHGKTVTVKKAYIWLLLTGQLDIGCVISEVLPKAENLLRDLAELIQENDRILHDFNPVFKEANAAQFQFRTTAKGTEKFWRYVASFSEGRSVRGFIRKFGRPKKGFADDLETLASSFSSEPVEKRIRLIAETFSSLTDDGTLVILGNDLDRRCAMHRLKMEQEEGVLAKFWHVNTYKAWDKKPLWRAKYPAKTEKDMRIMVRAKDEADWQSNFQQNPTPPEGFYFKMREFHYVDKLPKDARGVLYCDPNLSKKGMGDSTAIIAYLWSPSLMKKIVGAVRCRSFRDSNELLDIVLKMRTTIPGIRAIGFDGNVNQESTWTNNIRNWCRINKSPFPRVNYYRFHVDDLAKNTQADWNEDEILFMRGLFNSDEGNAWLMQVLSFVGKKANKADDGPDSLICADEMMNLMHLNKRRGDRKLGQSISIQSNYKF